MEAVSITPDDESYSKSEVTGKEDSSTEGEADGTKENGSGTTKSGEGEGKSEDKAEGQKDPVSHFSGTDALAKIRAASKKKRRKQIIVLVSLLVLILGGVGGYLVYQFYQNVRGTVTVEAGERVPEKDDFLYEPSSLTSCDTDLSRLDYSTPGEYPVRLSWAFFHADSRLIIIDTEAPRGKAKDLILEQGSRPAPQDFVESYDDATAVTMRFISEPNYDYYGEQSVGIILEDEGKNVKTLYAKLTLYDKTKGPVISGAENKSVYVGESITYRDGITVEDDIDPNPVLEIDNSQVDLDKPGVYPLSYSATDSCGRTATVTVNVHVEEKPANMVSLEQLHALADEKLETILDEDMSEIERVFAIFRFSRLAVPWIRTGSHDSEVDQALSGLQGNPGDCYTHAVVLKVLLERAGFIIEMVEKKNETGTHYWVMINLDGQWYHMDPSPIYIKQYCAFLSTTEELMEYARKYRPHLYDYEIENYPAASTVPAPATAVFKNDDYYLTLNGVEVGPERFGIVTNPTGKVPNAANAGQ